MKEILINNNWDESQAPFFTIITPVYNRENTIIRTLSSVENQKFKNIEYIIINDGSTDLSSSIVVEFMNNTSLPIMFIEKENGGVHTARNVGFKYARGQFVICIDSDDELLPEACQVFYDEWNSIPENEKDEYWQMKALCISEKGELCSEQFPSNINELNTDVAFNFFSVSSGEQIGCRKAAILKENMFPEPEYVKFVNEYYLWAKLEKQYKSWGINIPVRIYHTEGDDHISNIHKKNIQNCINGYWNSYYFIENKNIYCKSKAEYLIYMLRYNILKIILKKNNKKVIDLYFIRNSKDILVSRLLYLPSIVGSFVYRKKKMQVSDFEEK